MTRGDIITVGIVGLVVTGFGAIPLGIGLWIQGFYQELRTRALTTTGTVVGLERRSEGSSAFAVVLYHNQQGEPKTFVSSFGSYPPMYSVGQTVEVLYDPQSPEARPYIRQDLEELPKIFQLVGKVIVGVGLLILAIAVGMAIFALRT